MVSPKYGVHVASQRHDEIVQSPHTFLPNEKTALDTRFFAFLVEVLDLSYSDCYRRSIACSRKGFTLQSNGTMKSCKIPA